jgi:hypothetical protein
MASYALRRSLSERVAQMTSRTRETTAAQMHSAARTGGVVAGAAIAGAAGGMYGANVKKGGVDLRLGLGAAISVYSAVRPGKGSGAALLAGAGDGMIAAVVGEAAKNWAGNRASAASAAAAANAAAVQGDAAPPVRRTLLTDEGAFAGLPAGSFEVERLAT